MSISLYCPKCKKASKLRTVKCACGQNLKEANVYWVRFKMPDGKWRSKVVHSYNQAKQVQGNYYRESVEQSEFQIFRAPGIDNIWKDYLVWAKVNKRSWRDDETRWKLHIKDHVTGRRLDQITPRAVEAILTSMRERKNPKGKPYAPATVNQVLVLLKRVINWAIKRRLYNGINPCTRVEGLPFDNTVTAPFSKDHLIKLLQHISGGNERAALVIKFGLYTGRRRGEILQLKWENVNLETGYVSFIGESTKNKRTQDVPMNESAMEILRRCWSLKCSHWVFSSSTGAYYSTFENTWKRLKKRLKLPYRFHDLRHTFASYLASSGQVDIIVLKELLGHRELKMTQRYAHLINGALQRGSKVADSVFDFTKNKIPSGS